MVIMSSSEEDSYTMIYASLKHPIRRKILRTLSSQPQTFSDLQKQFKLESSHLTYHIDGLGNLLYKTEDGKYALSSLGEGAVSMMRNVEEPPTNSHFPFARSRSTTSEKRYASRAVAIALGIICIVLAATLVGAFAYYVPMINDKNNTISSLNSLISQLSTNATNLQNQLESLNLNFTNLQNQLASDNSTIVSLLSNVTYLQEELNNILNWSSSVTNMITTDPSPWENRTVIVEGDLSGILIYPVSEQVPWTNLLFTDNQSIGVLCANAKFINMSTISLKQVLFDYGPAIICGVVEKGEIYYTGLPSEVTYYIEADIVELL
jgi:DNA-binding transcriptional ArsR family regulator